VSRLGYGRGRDGMVCDRGVERREREYVSRRIDIIGLYGVHEL